MSRALVILNTPEARETVRRWILGVPNGTIVELKSPKRSTDQNSLLWARLSEIATQVDWYGQKLTPEDWKDVFTSALRKARIVPSLEGTGFVQLGLHTSDMDKEEFGNLLDLIDAFAAERNVVFHDPNSEAA